MALTFLWRVVMVPPMVVVALLTPFTLIVASALTLQVETSDTLPGFHIADLARYLAVQMSAARLADCRFEPSVDNSSAPDRVEWRFKLSPYAGGEVRSFARPHMAERIFGEYRSVTIEARLYLDGEYQTLVEKQAVIEGGPNDPNLAAAVADVTQTLLGPHGALPASDAERRSACGPR